MRSDTLSPILLAPTDASSGAPVPQVVPRVVAPGAGPVLHGPGGDLFIMKLVARDTGNQFSIAEYHVPVGGGPPLHVHTREDETFWVLEGSVTFQVGGKALAAPAGTTVFAPRGVPHTFRNVSGSPARMLVLVSPAQNFEDFYAAIARPNADGSPPTEQQSIERIGVEAPRYGLTILGPNPL